MQGVFAPELIEVVVGLFTILTRPLGATRLKLGDLFLRDERCR